MWRLLSWHGGLVPQCLPTVPSKGACHQNKPTAGSRQGPCQSPQPAQRPQPAPALIAATPAKLSGWEASRL
jgi:hypothetical protein